MAGENELLTPAAAGKYLGGIPIDTLRWWRWRRTGPTFCRVGRRVMYRRADLEAFVKQGEVEMQEVAHAS
ncbi:helix-turn-helix domain-containing protein [Rhizobium leguminosarum]|uniref:helix-turn-helix domain-containing protein n=1 Tax=Rhizobium ruizarguesonis TaxID=2081791 RepID=UPI0013BD91EE|nr:helix-turn-helix domain-containing protein [Rhizobium ruizarguesonis]NEJ05388.1 helix-turn-helix domain-containing protein [Rhizobium ruizarguesonis]QIJ40066.1 helix-turn-helix domain-containing protein [Rhizobium leguminosarum]